MDVDDGELVGKRLTSSGCDSVCEFNLILFSMLYLQRQFARNVAAVCEATERTIGEEIVDVVTKDFYKRVEGVSFEILEEVLAELRHELEEQKRNEVSPLWHYQQVNTGESRHCRLKRHCVPRPKWLRRRSQVTWLSSVALLLL